MIKRFLVVLLLVAPLITACDWSSTGRKGQYSGTLEMTEHGVGFPVPGRVAELKVDEGDTVTKGEVLAALDHYTQAKKDFDRAAQLLPSGGTSQQEYEHLKQAMEDLQLLSPIDGVVLTKVHESGEAVSAGNPILILGESKEIWVRIYVPEDRISRIKMGQKARIRIDGLSKETVGHVSYISPQAEFSPRNVQTPEERATQMFAVKVMLDQPMTVHPGVSADVEFLGS